MEGYEAAAQFIALLWGSGAAPHSWPLLGSRLPGSLAAQVVAVPWGLAAGPLHGHQPALMSSQATEIFFEGTVLCHPVHQPLQGLSADWATGISPAVSPAPDTGKTERVPASIDIGHWASESMEADGAQALFFWLGCLPHATTAGSKATCLHVLSRHCCCLLSTVCHLVSQWATEALTEPTTGCPYMYSGVSESPWLPLWATGTHGNSPIHGNCPARERQIRLQQCTAVPWHLCVLHKSNGEDNSMLRPWK